MLSNKIKDSTLETLERRPVSSSALSFFNVTLESKLKSPKTIDPPRRCAHISTSHGSDLSTVDWVVKRQHWSLIFLSLVYIHNSVFIFSTFTFGSLGTSSSSSTILFSTSSSMHHAEEKRTSSIRRSKTSSRVIRGRKKPCRERRQRRIGAGNDNDSDGRWFLHA